MPTPERGSACIAGFATDISVNVGDPVTFKIDTKPATTQFRIDIYRLGYYGGAGARKIASIAPLANAPNGQPACAIRAGLVDCGNWGASATWTVPSNAVSGIYVGKLVRLDGINAGAASHVTFIVRDDSGATNGGVASDILFQTSDQTWQAYNGFGGDHGYGLSLYNGAWKVSYNRPFTTRFDWQMSWYRSAEYPMIRWLEANGYNVSYTTGVDSERAGQRIRSHRVFLSVGHDEYWSAQQRATPASTWRSSVATRSSGRPAGRIRIERW